MKAQNLTVVTANSCLLHLVIDCSCHLCFVAELFQEKRFKCVFAFAGDKAAPTTEMAVEATEKTELSSADETQPDPVPPPGEAGPAKSPRPKRGGGGGGRVGPRSRNSTLTSLCILSHYPFFSTFRECLYILKRMVDCCSQRLIQRAGLPKGTQRSVSLSVGPPALSSLCLCSLF